MIVVQRRLFWKIYLTLLASLVAVAVLMGAFWSLVGESGRPRWGAFHLEVDERLIPERDSPPGAIAAAMKRLGDEMDADVSAYDARGALVAAQGAPIAFGEGERMRFGPPPHIVRIDLPDGRTVLARLRPPGPRPHLRMLSLVLLAAGGVGLAAFPLTARLTRRLEGLRTGVERWGAGELALRVDDAGHDEVAVVARAFNVAAGRIEDLLTSQRALLANASHELRSPLARLRMAIELWLARPSPDLLAEINRNLAESDGLVDEILLASRLDYDRAPRPPGARVDLTALAAEEAARLEPGAASLAESGAPVEIDGDATLLRRLIRNLLENAVKHGRPPVGIAVVRDGNLARVAVSDCGDGIAPEERERVFAPFYRPPGRSESSGGWGLGLSLVRQIAERHGGGARCEAAPGGGSRFVVDLAGDAVELPPSGEGERRT
ncbi:signal transduction histidine kinase [Roseiarcus fermentans]|uniref:histidine kinase n=1 Tax=Roseiarcus fermentans TaxID=1473586 RepID=A0A366EVN6_9HYPH|nr:HAMP domain-containing sensor histidine kinase [Roseiarcus fermentans]RBP05770.1 signal transduction histidine kinase [Roseiarcus fermentans]